MRRPAALAAALAAAVLTPAGPAAAFCQSLSVVNPDPSCDAACLTLEDFSEEEIAERQIVALSWRRSCVEWTLDPAGTPDLALATVRDAVTRSFARWTDVACDRGRVPFTVERLDVDVLECPYPDHRRGTRNVNIVTFANDWAERAHDATAFAITTTTFDRRTGEILGADLELNDEGRTWRVCPDGAGCDGALDVDLENVLVHELGHFFGLAHTTADRDATMWACAVGGEILKRDLAPDDEAGWCALYGGLPGESCSFSGTPRTNCTFGNEPCDPVRPRRCATGRCVDLGNGPRCSIPCEEPAEGAEDRCPPGYACMEGTLGAEAFCRRTGCSCRAGAGSAAPPGLLVLLALVALRARRRLTG